MRVLCAPSCHVVVSGSGTSKLADAGGLALLSTLMYVVTCQAGEGGPGFVVEGSVRRVACSWCLVWCCVLMCGVGVEGDAVGVGVRV